MTTALLGQQRIIDLKTEVMGTQKDGLIFTRNTAINISLTPIIYEYYDDNLYKNESNIPQEFQDKINELAKDHFLNDIFRTIITITEYIESENISIKEKEKYYNLLNELLSFEDHCLIYFFSKISVDEGYVERIKKSKLMEKWNLSNMDKKFTMKYLRRNENLPKKNELTISINCTNCG